jgi:Pretoxin HINT domain
MQASFLLLGLIWLADDNPASKAPTIAPEERRAFEAEKAVAAKDPNRLIKLAMWAESKGLTSERTALLKEATASDPKKEAAWGLLGQVAHDGAFKTPDEVGKEIVGDASQAAKLAEYNDRRDQLNRAEEAERSLIRRLEQANRMVEARVVQARIDHRLAPAHVKLGLWCESIGMKPEAQAHFTSAALLDPYLEIAWKHLGYVKHNSRWMNRDQIAAEAKELAAQHQAEVHWGPLLQRWKGWLGQDAKRATAEQELSGVNDPRALSSIVKTFVTANLKDQLEAVRLLGQVQSPASSQELAFLAVMSDFEPVRREAIESLKGRDVRDYAETLVKMIHKPWTYRVVPVQGPGSNGTLEIDSPRFHLIRTYDAPAAYDLKHFRGYAGIDPNGLPVVISHNDLRKYDSKPKEAAGILKAAEEKTVEAVASAQFKAESSRQRMIADVNDVELNNASSATLNSQVAPVLQMAAGAPGDLGDDEDAWNTWYYDKIGYRYIPPPQLALRQEFYQIPALRIISCFAAGTPVRTIEGPRAIETLRVGDRVLSQDPKSGGLSFQPILVVHHNPPDKTLEVSLENGDVLVASRFHRFWLAGRGWVMARDLKVGDVVRTLAGRSPIRRIENGPFLPVFNLDVAGGRTFFVGDHDALVHDNTMPATLGSLFDAKAEIAVNGSKP